VLHDLEATGLVEKERYSLRAPVRDPLGRPDDRCIAIEQWGQLATLLPWIDDSELDVYLAADSLQQLVTDVDEPSPWPACPAHAHALEPHLIGRVWRRAYWSCPQDAALRWLVGSLPAGSR
jgi:hypothetical protein